jgi:amino-acid N-acetyltransferase
MSKVDSFVNWLRSVAPYINAFRHRTFVIAFGGEVVSDGKFTALTHDINLLQSLGVRLVLVHGARPQTEERLKESGVKPRYSKGTRITDDVALKCVIEAAATMGFEIEAKLSMGVANSPMANSSIRVASGNFVTARPIGVVDGVDFQHTGLVRKIDAQGIEKRLEDGEIVLLPPLGWSATGEIFNLTVEEVATAAAMALNADKLIFLTDTPGVVDSEGDTISEMNAREAEEWLEGKGSKPEDISLYLPCAVRACRASVKRVHLITRHIDGALLQELFTREGIGTLVTRDSGDLIRAAQPDDVPGLLAIIEPLEEEGVLVKRSRILLESEIDRFSVLVYDQQIIGCVALYPLQGDAGELACLAIRPEYRNEGRGEDLLSHAEARARKLGLRRLFLLSTRTGQWFAERGFAETSVSRLPQQKQALYNYQRRSKVFVKKITNKISKGKP